jgi:hypothetical protein
MSETGESAIDDALPGWLEMQGRPTRRRSTTACLLRPHGLRRQPRLHRTLRGRLRETGTNPCALPVRPEPVGLPSPGNARRHGPRIYVGGGSTANLLALWRRHGVDEAMRRAADGGTILAGISAGANCWFEASSTDSFGPLAPLNDGLGFLTGSACPHFHGEPGREESFLRWIERGPSSQPRDRHRRSRRGRVRRRQSHLGAGGISGGESLQRR